MKIENLLGCVVGVKTSGGLIKGYIIDVHDNEILKDLVFKIKSSTGHEFRLTAKETTFVVLKGGLYGN